jgi:hypothetical protein
MQGFFLTMQDWLEITKPLVVTLALKIPCKPALMAGLNGF